MLGPGWPCPALEGAFLVLLAPLLPGPPPFSSLAALPACLQTPLLLWSRPGHCCAHALHLLCTVCGHTGPSVRWAGGVGDTACVGEGLHLEAGCRGEECEDGGQGGGRGLSSWRWREGFAEEGQGSWASGESSRRRRGVPRGGRERVLPSLPSQPAPLPSIGLTAGLCGRHCQKVLGWGLPLSVNSQLLWLKSGSQRAGTSSSPNSGSS